MDSRMFTRDPGKVYSCLSRTDNNEVVCTKPVKVYIPARYPQAELANFEAETSFLGVCAFVVEDKFYAISMVNAFMRTEPSLVNTVNIDDTDYIEMSYDAGARVIANMNLVKIDNLLYKIYDEMIAKGRVPWYLNYNDLGKLFATSRYHSGPRVGANPAVFEMIVAAICRSPDDVKKYYRQWITGAEQVITQPPTVIPLRVSSYGATNTIAKLMGPYFDENVTSALISPGQRVERVERLLRL